MASVKLVLRTNQEDKTGHCPLYIRVIKDRKAKFISAGQKLLPSEWDDAKQKVKKNHPNSARLNAFLSQKIADAEGQVADISRKNSSFSAHKLKEAIKGKDSKKFFDYANERLAKMENSVGLGTHKRYTKDLEKFKEYVNNENLYFDEFTPVLLNDYVNYCLNTLGNKSSTVNTNIKFLKTVYLDATREGIIPITCYPFSKIKLKKEPDEIRFLSREQIDQIKSLSLVKFPTVEKYRDMFLFSIYAGGLRRSDIISLQWSHIDMAECKLSKKIRKTGNFHSFRLVEPALNILKKYLPAKKSDDSFVFGLVKNEVEFINNKYYAFDEIRRIGQGIINNLDRISKLLEFPINITFHMSRHTFATNALNNGMRLEHISKIMDHSSIKITKGYAKVINAELDKSMEAVYLLKC